VLTTYTTYKDSEVEWVGEVPSHYRIGKLKHLCDENQRSLSNSTDPNYELNYIEISDVNSKGVIEKSTPYIFSESPSRCRRIVQRGDVIVSTVRTYLKSIGLIEEEVEDLICSTGFSVLTPRENINPKYLFYLLRTEWFISMVISNSEGVSYPSIQSEKLMNINVVFCDFSEQQQIVSFLDTKTSLIDSLIEKTQRNIELLKEKRTSLINEVVTKGLNPNVDMKDSGVEWIGEIPSHWKTKKLKYLSKIIYGISPPDTTYNDEGVGTLLINGPVEYSKTDFGYTRSLKWTTEPKKFTTKGSLLFCLRGSTTGRMNITHTDVSIGRGVCSINSKEDQWFLIYSMFSVRRWIQDQISGSTFPSVTSDDVDNYVICSPPINEQEQIVEYLDEQTQLIDKTISNEVKRTELLNEYRQSLISEVVTGKRKVVE